jgi:hypothetical protein
LLLYRGDCLTLLLKSYPNDSDGALMLLASLHKTSDADAKTVRWRAEAVI